MLKPILAAAALLVTAAVMARADGLWLNHAKVIPVGGEPQILTYQSKAWNSEDDCLAAMKTDSKLMAGMKTLQDQVTTVLPGASIVFYCSQDG